MSPILWTQRRIIDVTSMEVPVSRNKDICKGDGVCASVACDGCMLAAPKNQVILGSDLPELRLGLELR